MSKNRQVQALNPALAAFLDPTGERQPRRSEDRLEGARVFFRMGDAERLELVEGLIRAWKNKQPLNKSMFGGAMRCAWDSEPYLDGVRMGSYVSAVLAKKPRLGVRDIGELASAWGPMMMTPDEMQRLGSLDFPLTVFRGGAGRAAEVGRGVSWTLSQATAIFYASKWPRRWGNTAPPVVLAMEIGRADVVALFQDRSEDEVLVPRARRRLKTMRRIELNLTGEVIAGSVATSAR